MFGGKIAPAELRTLARELKFQRRAIRKIDPAVLVAAWLKLTSQGACSFNDLAACIDSESGCLVSRQAVAKRLGKPFVRLLEAVLARVMADRATVQVEGLHYLRVLVQDSTVIRLPTRLFSEFGGVSNGATSVCNARIQAVCDLLNGTFISFSMDPYCKNDRAAAPELELRKGDLVLRDRGYLTLDEIQRHLDAGADCIYRHTYGTRYLDPKTDLPIDLPALLRQHGSIDMDVCLNNESRTPVRLLAAPVDEETANLRRMKLKREKKGHAPSKALLEQAGWTIFITTIPRERASFSQILDLYGLRWRIETFFKAWKSELHMDCIHNVSAHQLRAILLARMAVLVTGTRDVFHRAQLRIREHYQKSLSMIKTIRFIATGQITVAEIDLAMRNASGPCRQLDRLARYCTYDQRRRENFNQKLERWTNVWALS